MPVKEDGVCKGLVRMVHHVHSWQCCVAWAEGTRGAMLATAHMVVMNVCLSSVAGRYTGSQLCVFAWVMWALTQHFVSRCFNELPATSELNQGAKAGLPAP